VAWADAESGSTNASAQTWAWRAASRSAGVSVAPARRSATIAPSSCSAENSAHARTRPAFTSRTGAAAAATTRPTRCPRDAATRSSVGWASWLRAPTARITTSASSSTARTAAASLARGACS
jgi:hypothetical protein